MRIFCALFLLIVGILAFLVGYSLIYVHHSVYLAALTYEAINIPVDLSVPAKYRGTFNQRFKAVHGKQFRFEMEPPFISKEEMLEALQKFKATLTIEQGGTIILSEKLDIQNFKVDESPLCRSHAPQKPFTPYAFIRSFDTKWKPCTLILTVTNAAISLNKRKQRLISKNVNCSTEILSYYAGIAILFFGICIAIIGIYLVRSFIKKQKLEHK